MCPPLLGRAHLQLRVLLVDGVAHAGDSCTVLLKRGAHRAALDVLEDADGIRTLPTAAPVGGAADGLVPPTVRVEELGGDVPVADAAGGVVRGGDGADVGAGPVQADAVDAVRNRDVPDHLSAPSGASRGAGGGGGGGANRGRSGERSDQSHHGDELLHFLSSLSDPM